MVSVGANLEGKPPGYYAGTMHNDLQQGSVFEVYEGPVTDPEEFITLPTFLTCVVYWDGCQMQHPSKVESDTLG